jgi:hypothetical protein
MSKKQNELSIEEQKELIIKYFQDLKNLVNECRISLEQFLVSQNLLLDLYKEVNDSESNYSDKGLDNEE